MSLGDYFGNVRRVLRASGREIGVRQEKNRLIYLARSRVEFLLGDRLLTVPQNIPLLVDTGAVDCVVPLYFIASLVDLELSPLRNQSGIELVDPLVSREIKNSSGPDIPGCSLSVNAWIDGQELGKTMLTSPLDHSHQKNTAILGMSFIRHLNVNIERGRARLKIHS